MKTIETRVEKKLFELKQRGKSNECRECEGFGHVQAECANTLKKSRSLNITLSAHERREDSVNDEDDKIEHSDSVAFNVVVNIKDTTLLDEALY